MITNRPVNQAEQIFEEESAGLRLQRSITEQIFIQLKAVGRKALEHQKELFHNFVNFRKAFDHFWHDGLG